jgi:hypothetical protein
MPAPACCCRSGAQRNTAAPGGAGGGVGASPASAVVVMSLSLRQRPGAEQPEPGHPPRAHDAVRVPDWNPNGAASSFALSFAGKRDALEAQGGGFS